MTNYDNYETPAVRIIVIGVGGAGSNAVNRMIDDEVPVEFYVMNTDLQSLNGSKVPASNRIILGKELTRGEGAGGNPEMGRKAAEASIEEIRRVVKGANMVFIAAGMGGGTGTGAAPVVASVCREEKALTVAIVTRPFNFEGNNRFTNSISGLQALKDVVDSIIVVSNDKLLMANGTDSISKAFQESDKVLAQSAKTVTDLILTPGIINLDFADIRNTLENSGNTLIGFGIGEGGNKANDAANAAISSPLLETPINGARRAICAVTCGPEVSLYEAQECVNRIIEEAGNGVDVKLGVSINDQIGDKIMVSVIASDFANEIDYSVKGATERAEVREETPAATTEEQPSAVQEAKEEHAETEEEDILPDFLKGKNID